MNSYNEVLTNANEAKKILPLIGEDIRVKAMEAMSIALKENASYILEENAKDLALATDILPVMRKRLSLTKEKLFSIADDIISVSKLDSVCNKVL